MIKAFIFSITCILYPALAFPLLELPGTGNARNELKSEILSLADRTKRGLDSTPDERAQMQKLFSKLERLNPTKNPLKSEKVNGRWSLDYTTSDSILGKGGFPRVGPIVQMIDTTSLKAENSEVVSYFGLRIPRKIEAKLTPESGQFTKVQFKKFGIGPISFNAPESFQGALDITYVDDEVRLTRGDLGNIFVLTRMET